MRAIRNILGLFFVTENEKEAKIKELEFKIKCQNKFLASVMGRLTDIESELSKLKEQAKQQPKLEPFYDIGEQDEDPADWWKSNQ